MSDLPEPLTPAECDLRGYDFMPLFTSRLLDSDLYALSTGAEFKAALTLWCKSWQQIPAGSLPNDDRILAHLSMSGAQWPTMRAMALRGWVLCQDGRLYHPVIAAEALKAFEMRRKERERKARLRARQKVTASSRGTDRRQTTSFRADKDSDSDTDKAGTASLRSAGTKRSHRLPASWQPHSTLIQYAQSLGLNPEYERDGFCDYWHASSGANAAKRDWDAAFRTWCRKSAERRPHLTPARARPLSPLEKNRHDLLQLAQGALS